MGVLTPTSAVKVSLGSRDGVIAAFSAITSGDTYESGMSKVEHVSITNGASGQTVGYTVSGGIVTILSSGALANVTVLIIGFK